MTQSPDIRPAYPPWNEPQAPVPGVSMPPGIWPDGTPASPGPALPYPSPSHQTGKSHGIQLFPKWAPGETQKKGLVDDLRATHLWRLVIFGGSAMRVDIKYGTQKTITLIGLSLPLRASFPGQLTVEAYPFAAQETEQSVRASLTPATAGGLIEMRRPVDAGAGAVAFDDQAMRYFALTASVVDVRGTPVAVPVLGTLPLVSGSSLTSGSGFEELDA